MSIYNATFMGFAPLTNPAIVVVVTVNGTHLMGADASAPAFKVIAQEALRILNVPKDLPETLVAEESKPSGQKLEEGDAIADLAADGAAVAEGEDAEDGEETPVLVAAAPVPVGPKVPNFRGKTMRAVVEEASAQGVSVLLDGSGIARMQQPPPGSVLHPGERIRVQFAR
jgi:cell division protein FtsI (penicillin-binding protein 3)